MAIDLTGMLSAFSNAGTGYLAGQQTATQNNVNNQMNQLALGEQQLKYKQDQLAAQNQQAMSDDAMKAFSATAGIQVPGQTPTPPGNAVPPAQMPDAVTPTPTSPTAGMDTAQKMDFLANNAAGRGDVVGANELWTNATNVRNSQATVQQHQSAIQTAELERKIKSHGLTAEILGSATDADDFNNKKFQVLGSGLVSPEEAQNISKMQYSPEGVAAIRAAGMNSSQQAQAQLRQQQEQERQSREAMDEERKDRDEARKDASQKSLEDYRTRQAKTGATNKAPSNQDLKTATPIIAKALGVTQDDESLNDVDPIDPKKSTQATPAVINIVSRAKQLSDSNKALTYAQAVSQATQEAMQNGELTKTVKPGGMFGSDKTVGKYSEKGTQASPLSLPKNASQLIPGKYYLGSDGKVEMWTGK